MGTASPAITGANYHRVQRGCPQRITPDLQNQAEKIKLEDLLTKLFERHSKYFHLIVILYPTFIKKTQTTESYSLGSCIIYQVFIKLI